LKAIKHAAIIMDGNGRWAQKKNLPRLAGHERGVKNCENIIEASIEQNLQYVSLFAFSTENWRRPKNEVNGLMNLLKRFFKSDVERLIEKDIKILVSGDRGQFTPEIKSIIQAAEDKSQFNQKLVVNIALNYSGRWDILNATRKILTECKSQNIEPEQITEEYFKEYLDKPFMPYPDLLIRTGNEMRISNFFLWQAAYTELYFSTKMWPEFSKEDFAAALAEFGNRQRRFGGL
jgi:undecaprenyl diphosphate synthase